MQIKHMGLTLKVVPKTTTAKPPIHAFLFCEKSLENLDENIVG
jgi:hypothetical protein